MSFFGAENKSTGPLDNLGEAPNIVCMKLHDELATARAAVGLSLRALERKTGISNALLQQYESGHVKEPSFRNVVKIARALGLSLTELAEAK